MVPDLQPGDEIVRTDRQSDEVIFRVRRRDKSLAIVTLAQPVWTEIHEIGFIIEDVTLSDPDPEKLAQIKQWEPELELPAGLRELHVKDSEAVKIIVIFAGDATTRPA